MCDARQYSDQMQCPCGLAWDVNDPDPPSCPEDGKPAPASGMPEYVKQQIEALTE